MRHRIFLSNLQTNNINQILHFQNILIPLQWKPCPLFDSNVIGSRGGKFSVKGIGI